MCDYILERKHSNRNISNRTSKKSQPKFKLKFKNYQCFLFFLNSYIRLELFEVITKLETDACKNSASSF